MSSTDAGEHQGLGFFGILTLILITLRLTGVIAWPWVWVLAPLWIPLTLWLTIGMVMIVVYVIADSLK